MTDKQRWEYEVFTFNHKDHKSIERALACMNVLGDDGWELVNVTYRGWGENVAYFKRQVASGPDNDTKRGQGATPANAQLPTKD